MLLKLQCWFLLYHFFNNILQSQSISTSLNFSDHNVKLRLNESKLSLLRTKNCVDVLLNNKSEYEITDLLADLRLTVVLKEKNHCFLHECTNHLFLVSNSSKTLDFDFKGKGITERNNTLIFILNQNQKWLKNDEGRIFGNARVIVIYKDMVEVLDSPSQPMRSFRELTSNELNSVSVWQGVESKDYIKGGIVKVATFDCPLFSMTDNTTGHIQGIEAEIVKEMTKQLNLSIILTPLAKSNYSNYGLRLDNGTWVGGVLGALYDRTADLGFCALWMSFDRDEHMEQTTPWGRVDLTFLVPRPRLRSEHWHTIFLPFHLHTWIAIIITFTFASISHWFLLKASYFMSLSKNKTDFPAVVVGMFGALTQCSSMVNRGRHSLLVFCWYILCVVLVALYSSQIVSRLALPLYTERIDSVRQLVQQGFIWGRPFQSNTSSLLNLQDYWQKKFRAEHFRMVKANEMHNLLMSGKFAFSAQVLEKYYVFSSDFYHLQDSELINLRVMDDFTNQYMVSIQLARGSPIYPACNLQIQWLLALGLVDYWKKDVVRRHNRSLMLRLMINTDQPSLSEPSPLALHTFQGAFLFLFMGLTISILTFLFELYSKKSQTTNLVILIRG